MKVKCSVSHKRVWRKEGRKNKSMVSARGEEERGNKMGGGYSTCFTARRITGEAARLTTVVPSSLAGAAVVQTGTACR
jgi:hypothetical protein